MYYQDINSEKESILEFDKTDIYIKQKIRKFFFHNKINDVSTCDEI